MELLTVDDVAQRLKRSKSTIYKWICLGEHLGPKFKKLGGKPMISEDDLIQYYEDQK